MSKKFNPKSLDELYAKYPWKSFEKFSALAKRYGYTDLPEIRKFIKNKMPHDMKHKDMIQKPIFSDVKNSYQMDTLIQPQNKNPFLIFININTRKAYAYELKNKSSSEIRRCLIQFKRDVKVINSLTSDQDSAYLSYEVLKLIKNMGISYRTTEDNNHNVLGIINRFMRTLRDLNGEENVFTNKRMQELIDLYNNAPHKSLDGLAPNDIDENIEDEYINEKQAETIDIEQNIEEFTDGDRVRIILDKKKIGKNRSNLSPKSYVIDGKDGGQYIIKAKDGSIDKYPANKLVKCDERFSLAPTIKNDKRGVIEQIISYDEKKDKYKVLFDEGTTDSIPAKNLRESNPTKLSSMEIEFWENKVMPAKIKQWT